MNIELKEVNKVPYVVIDDVLTEDELKEVWATLDSFPIDGLLPGSETGTAFQSETYRESKQNKGIFLDTLYSNAPQLCRMIRPLMPRFDEICREISKLHPAFRSLAGGWEGSILCSYYENGDYYDEHQDSSPITALFWLAKDQSKFEGGNLLLEREEPILFEHNRIVIFPGYCLHQVSPVKMKIKDSATGFGRWCVSLFSSK